MMSQKLRGKDNWESLRCNDRCGPVQMKSAQFSRSLKSHLSRPWFSSAPRLHHSFKNEPLRLCLLRVVWVAAFWMLPFSFWFIIAVCQAGQGLLQSWLCLGLVHLSKSYDSSSNAFQLKLLNKFQRLPIFPLHSATARKPDICCWGLRQNGVQPVWRVVVYSGLTLNCSMYIFVLSPNCPLSAVQNLSHL